MLETVNGIDLVLAVLAGLFLTLWRIERSSSVWQRDRVNRGLCWLDSCILDAGHRGLHKD